MPPEAYSGRTLTIYLDSIKDYNDLVEAAHTTGLSVAEFSKEMIRRGRETLTASTGPDLSMELQESRQEVARLRADLREKEAALLALRARLFAEQHKLFLADEDGRGKLSGDLLAILQRPGHHRAPDIMKELGIDPENGPAMRALAGQIRALQDMGMIEEGLTGWRWIHAD